MIDPWDIEHQANCKMQFIPVAGNACGCEAKYYRKRIEELGRTIKAHETAESLMADRIEELQQKLDEAKQELEQCWETATFILIRWADLPKADIAGLLLKLRDQAGGE